MKLTVFAAILFVYLRAYADDKRIVPTDALGHRQSHKPSYVLKDGGRILAEDAFGNRRTHSMICNGFRASPADYPAPLMADLRTIGPTVNRQVRFHVSPPR